MVAGILAAALPQRLLSYNHAVSEVSIRTVFGIIVFILTAILFAGGAAFLQAYPLGIGGLIVG